MWTCKLVPGPDSKTEFMWWKRKIIIGFTQEITSGVMIFCEVCCFFFGNFDIFCTIKKWSRRLYRPDRLAYIGCFRVFLGVMLLDEKRGRRGKKREEKGRFLEDFVWFGGWVRLGPGVRRKRVGRWGVEDFMAKVQS